MEMLTTVPAAPAPPVDAAEAIVRRSAGLAPSASLIRLEARLRSGSASVAELGRLTEGSPALAARVLRLANSVFYSARQPILALNRAIVVIDDIVLRQVVLHAIVAGGRPAARSRARRLRPRDSWATRSGQASSPGRSRRWSAGFSRTRRSRQVCSMTSGTS